MSRFFTIACLSLALVWVAGCSPAKKGVPLSDVKGTVTLDGKALAEGEITFSIPGEPVNTLPIKEGAYAGKASVGKNKVEIRAYKTAPPSPTALSTDGPPKANYIPARYNDQTTLSAEVAAGSNDIPAFAVTSK